MVAVKKLAKDWIPGRGAFAGRAGDARRASLSLADQYCRLLMPSQPELRFFPPFQDHLRAILRSLETRPELKPAFKDILNGRGCENPITADLLIAEGLAKFESGWVVPGCRLYEDYFRQYLH